MASLKQVLRAMWRMANPSRGFAFCMFFTVAFWAGPAFPQAVPDCPQGEAAAPGRTSAFVFQRWDKIPIVTFSARSGDPRIQWGLESVDCWNKRLASIETPFRLSSVIHTTQIVPVQFLEAVSEAILGGQPLPELPESVQAMEGDIIVAMSDGDFISFSARFGGKAVIGIRSESVFPLTLPNVPRNVIAHELGHAIGMGHNDDPTKLMCGRPADCRPDEFRSNAGRFFPLTLEEEESFRWAYPPGSIRRPAADYDGDGKTDAAVYEESTDNWLLLGSLSGFFIPAANFGGAGFIPVPGDYDGDRKTDPAVYEESTGNWFVAGSLAGFFSPALNFGGAEFTPVPGDYDGDGRFDPGVYQRSTGHWFYAGSGSGFGQHLAFGGPGFIPVPADYDGDGTTDTAVHQTATGNWFIAQSSAGFLIYPSFGGAGFVPVRGDFDGDGKTDAAVYEEGTGNWFVVGSSFGFFTPAVNFGGPGFVPVAGDYDGDGQTDAALYEESTGNWFVVGSSSGFFTPALNFGGLGFLPVLP
jgi:hypothetical protein